MTQILKAFTLQAWSLELDSQTQVKEGVTDYTELYMHTTACAHMSVWMHMCMCAHTHIPHMTCT